MNIHFTASTWITAVLGLVISISHGVTGSVLAQPAIPPPYGRYIHLGEDAFAGVRSYSVKDRIVGTYYFYWYCVDTKEHIVNGNGTDALTDHPASMDHFSYRSVRWHKQQLLDMMAAGIDVALPVFWGAPSERESKSAFHWSYAGLEKLVQARQELLDEGKQPPRIGMFYDTSTLQHNQYNQHIDLTTDYGRQWFYATVRDFFSLVPPRHWAMIDGKPIVLLYAAAFAKKYDQSFIDYAKQQFAQDFTGRVPWIAAEVSWQVKTDSKVVWGGALGLKNAGVAALGPGYDHSAVPGRAPLIQKREGGQFYENNWILFLRRPSNFVMVETWNEFHEGTDVADSKEYGRQYIDLTRKYSDLFKQGWKPSWPQGAYDNARSVGISLGGQNREEGLRLVDNEDGRTTPAMADGSPCRAIRIVPNFGHYIYFAADDSFKEMAPITLKAEVEFYDAGQGALTLEYDRSDPNAPFAGAYTPAAEVVRLEGKRNWKTAVFTLKDASLVNSQNGRADFRLNITASEFMVRKVTIMKVKTP
ncbi:MAG: DUF5010 domain-containing protein [Candidatus Sumerlaeota bacterium]|nr:DUF5010 domain-containing protein [Candidatus Sumerlaeota bacterium]